MGYILQTYVVAMVHVIEHQIEILCVLLQVPMGRSSPTDLYSNVPFLISSHRALTPRKLVLQAELRGHLTT